ncbi:MAG: exported protein of unknown function [Candidatus Saccharibacteria bacterium]|nr:exported protein of unknown function [Candidatus Saccharibacteria bacterium]
MNTTHTRTYEQGGVSGSLLAIIGLIVLVLVAGSFAIWAYLNYNEQKTNVDGKIDLAVVQGKKVQSDEDEKKFAEREKEPNRQFVGPDDYGRLTFDYPKTWSVYEATDISKGGDYEAYLNPITVPPVTSTQQYSLRVLIQQKDYDQIVKSYEALVKKGDLRSTATSADGNNGTRFDGNFSKNIRGSAVIYRIRDKTLTVQTDADTFKPDFENIIKTIKFNQ